MKLRFSLRALLVLVAAVATFGYWRSRPSAIARKFEQAIAARNYALADDLFEENDQRFLANFINSGYDNRITAERVEQSFGNWLRGVNFIEVTTDNENRPWDGPNSMQIGGSWAGLPRRVMIVRRFTVSALGVRPDHLFK